ncbi:MAG: hypothetical protein L6R48_03890 [Planctomycetes bacterium]|nr:hypothetical protein [Planctomycetota bacterium]
MSPSQEVGNLVQELIRRHGAIRRSGDAKAALKAKRVVAGIHGLTCLLLGMATSYLAGSSAFRIELKPGTYARAAMVLGERELEAMIAGNVAQLVAMLAVGEQAGRTRKMRVLINELHALLDDANTRLHRLAKQAA